MQITEVRIKLMDDGDDRLQAFCSITFDDSFVVRDLKIIEGTNGSFVAMPSRKLTSHCPSCRCKNHMRAQFCNQCGSKLNPQAAARDSEGRAKLYADIAHPVNSACREMIQERVVSEYRMELERAKHPDYVSRYDDDFDTDIEHLPAVAAPRSPPAPERVRSESLPSHPPASSTHPAIDRPHVQPAETQVRAPHSPPIKKQGATPKKHNERDFGSGILDET